MRRCLALAVATVAWQAACFMTGAQAQDEDIRCDAFYRNFDGSWTATQSVFLAGARKVSRVGGVFRPGVAIDGHDVAAALDKACPNPATSPPAGPNAAATRVVVQTCRRQRHDGCVAPDLRQPRRHLRRRSRLVGRLVRLPVKWAHQETLVQFGAAAIIHAQCRCVLQNSPRPKPRQGDGPDVKVSRFQLPRGARASSSAVSLANSGLSRA